MNTMTDNNMDHSGSSVHDGNRQKLVGTGSMTLSQAISQQTTDTDAAAHATHISDDNKVSDHTALLDLFPDAADSGTSVAINGGSWFDPNTWADGKVPQNGQDVYIPKGIAVIYDGESDARLETVGVDGELHFAVDVDTRMVLDTLVSGTTSVLTMGVEENPVQEGVTLDVVFHRDNGAVGGADDPKELGRGMIAHGATEIVGQDKADFLNVDTPPRAGDTVLSFATEPDGWQVGDKLVVAGTRLLGPNEFQDEVVTIKSISQASDGSYNVELNQALEFDHVPPKAAEGNAFQVPVANYTRNIMLSTETDGDQYLGDGKSTPTDERAHVMFMHGDNVIVKNAEFFELGRTDKSEMLSDENVAGRYALHFHRTGVDDIDNPALAEGNAVWGSPGWGIVHHDSNVDVISNAVFGVNGGAIIAEAGNETGIWADNITIQTTGEYTTLNSEQSGVEDHPAGRQELLDDSFTQGIGFGFKSRLLVTVDNVAVSSNAAGYSFMPMGIEGGSPSNINPLVEHFESIYGYNPFFGGDDEGTSRIPNRTFIGNTSMVSHVGLNTSADKRPSKTDVPTVIEDFTAWEVAQGFGGFYQRDYLVKDSYFYGLQDGFLNGMVKDAAGANTSGIMAREFHELKLVNNTFENFDVGIFEQSHDNGPEYIHVILGNSFIDVIDEQQLDVDNSAAAGAYIVNNNSANWDANLDVGRLDASVNMSKSDLVMTEWFDQFSVVVNKVDTLGSVQLTFGSEKTRNGGASQKTWWVENAENKGYFTENGKFYLVIDIAVGDRVTGSVGVLKAAVELAFVDNAGDLPDGAVNNGALPNDLYRFEMVDVRVIGESGDQLNPVSIVHEGSDSIDPDAGGGNDSPTVIEKTDINDEYNWESYTDVFDANGMKISRSMIYDDGRTIDTSYANGVKRTESLTDTGDRSWSTIDRTFSADGAVTLETAIYDAGHKVVSKFTDGELSSRGSYTSDGTLVFMKANYDDGRTIDTSYANGVKRTESLTDTGDRSWSTIDRTFSADGAVTSQTAIYDDGRTSETFFTDGVQTNSLMIDATNVHDWATYADSYDTLGDLASRITIYDDGREVFTDFG